MRREGDPVAMTRHFKPAEEDQTTTPAKPSRGTHNPRKSTAKLHPQSRRHVCGRAPGCCAGSSLLRRVRCHENDVEVLRNSRLLRGQTRRSATESKPGER